MAPLRTVPSCVCSIALREWGLCSIELNVDITSQLAHHPHISYRILTLSYRYLAPCLHVTVPSQAKLRFLALRTPPFALQRCHLASLHPRLNLKVDPLTTSNFFGLQMLASYVEQLKMCGAETRQARSDVHFKMRR